jgi:hypothetical protein
MRFWARLGLFFYMLIVMVLSLAIATFVIHWPLSFQDVQDVLWKVYDEKNLRIIFGGIAVLLLFLNHIYSRAISGAQQKEKTIAFDNPSGRVSVSLAALEDLIRRVVARVPEVKEVRPTIKATGKGLEIFARLVLNTEANIPDMTARLQDLIKRKVQDTIGIEETVVVKIDVIKIIPEDRSSAKRNKNNKESDNIDEPPTVPFQGYRA